MHPQPRHRPAVPATARPGRTPWPPAIDRALPGYTPQIPQRSGTWQNAWVAGSGQRVPDARPGGGGGARRARGKSGKVEWNPTTDRLRELTEKMPNAVVTEFGNVVVKAKVDSRSTKSTYIVEDSTDATKQTMTRAEYERIAAAQDAYIAGCHMVVVDGYIGSDPQFRTRARLVMEAANANVAGMQKQLYYPVGEGYDPAAWEPDTTVIYTPNLARPGLPERPGHRRRPERQHHPRAQLRLLRRVEEGRAADVEQHRLQPRRTGAARRLQGHAWSAGGPGPSSSSACPVPARPRRRSPPSWTASRPRTTSSR